PDLERRGARVNAAAGQLLELIFGHLTSLCGFGSELLIDVVEQPLHGVALVVRKSGGAAENAAVLAAADDVGGDADLVVEPVQCELAPHDADRTGDRAGVGEDAVGPHGDVVPAR